MMRRRLFAIAALLAGCQVAEAPSAPVGTFTLAAIPHGASAAPDVPSERPTAPVSSPPAPTPTPTPPGRGGKGGGGSGPAPQVAGQIALDTGFTARRVAGAAEGGGALGTDGLSARLMGVSGIAIAPDGTLYLADPVRHEVRMVPPAGPTVVVAGLGTGGAGFMGDNVPADATALNTPMGLCYEPVSGAVVVADAGNDRIRLFTPGARIYTLAGGGSSGAETVSNPLSARLQRPTGLTADGAGRVIFTERTTGRVRRVSAASGVTTLATVAVEQAGPVAARWDGERVWVGEGGAVRLVVPGAAPALDPAPVASFPDAAVTGLAYDQAGALYALVTGLDGARVYRLAVGDDGRMPADRAPERVAGRGGVDADASAYEVPASGGPDAASVLLGGAWQTQLAIDLTHAADPTRLAGALYVGSSLDEPDLRFGQVLALTARE